MATKPTAAAHAAAPETCIDDYDSVDIATMKVIPPGGATPIATISFAGPGHPKVVALAAEATRKRLFEERQRQINNRWKPEAKTVDQVRHENVASVADRIVGWTDIKRRGEDGVVSQIPYAAEAAIELLIDPHKDWLFGQCVDFLTALDTFTPGSAKT